MSKDEMFFDGLGNVAITFQGRKRKFHRAKKTAELYVTEPHGGADAHNFPT